MKQQLYIHIGMPKTGTTGFQYFMHRNRKQLRAQGVYYPVTMREPHPTATQHRFVNEYLRRMEREGMASVKEFPNPIRRISHEIKQQGIAKNVISEELFSYDPASIADFLSGFKAHFDTKIVVLLRRQDTWAESMYAQSIRGGYRETFKRFLAARNTTERLDFVSFLGVWAKYFGAENVIAVPYADRVTKTPKVMAEILGLDLSVLDLEEQRNPSLTGEAISFIHGMRSLKDVGYPKFNRLFADALTEATKKGSAVYFDSADRAEFLESFKAGNDEVVRKYMGKDPETDPLFDVDPANFPSEEKLMRPLTDERREELLRVILEKAGDGADTASISGGTAEERIEKLMDLVETACRNSTLAV